MGKKVAVIGHFGVGLNLINGQTVKTVTLADGFEKYTDMEVKRIDTHNWTQKPFELIKGIKEAFKACDAVVMLPAHNGVKIFAPLLLCLKKQYNKKIFYSVIGGWLPEFLANKKALKNTLKNFDGIWVETNVMKNALEKQGFCNILVVPNFKELKVLGEEELVHPKDKPYRLCTFSRVMREKGIEDAVNAVKNVNEKLGETMFSLDIYGEIDSNQLQWFEKLKESFPYFVNYGGKIPFDKSTDVLKDYFALLFPTYYEGEGFAGTLVDAMAAGLPTVSSDWRYNSEIVTEDIGFLYPTGNQQEFENILFKIADNPELITDMKKSCIKKAKEYTSEKNINFLVEQMESM